ncbi:alpha/beta-hydrolase [Aaosphaeria arxii CBS 175.79]|uniref:Carboxylic ester hydrolase n=1 Tax=Aaosphaeria arxii CBS 175.79 TaxID=1450172 RepID=A0A6A5XSI2_9PLEO|nr:alpha/beta-hydrolase [Aaosphaeria arxii CBS 175.79]KAF2015214.1 alpha/beta-hydrolase [Aaosphaeria arxii CBS 175.79]
MYLPHTSTSGMGLYPPHPAFKLSRTLIRETEFAPRTGVWNGDPLAPTVRIRNGTVEGVHSAQYAQDFFLGIPFAQPPVGELRFRPAQPIASAWTSPLNARQYSSACIGYGSDQWPYPSISEDCLYLNVVRPSGYENSTLPVAFWIHGGGLAQGSAIDQRYNMSFIVERSVEIGKPIIGVSINYRLSMFGFVNGEEVVESGNANLGFRDQRLGLAWVQENIEAFGGDPKQVTIFGESAGALSVGMHLTAYGGRDDHIFRGAIMQSGNPINYGTFNYNASNLLVAGEHFNCPDKTSILPCLRSIDTDTLSTWINSTRRSLRWSPIIDGDFIQGKTSLQLAAGAFVHVPIISGANSDEGTAFGPKPMNTTSQFFSNLTQVPMPVPLTPSQASAVLAAYPSNITYGAVPTNQPLSYTPGPGYGAESRRSDAYYGDVTMIASRRKTCQTWTANGIPAYCYRFNTIPHGLPAEIGATHFQEVAFVFNNQLGVGYGYPNVSENPFEGMPEGYFGLAEMMSAAWIGFVHDGVPSDGGAAEFWPSYGEGKNWVFDANVTGLGYEEKDDWRKEGIALINSWDEDVYQR